MLPLTRQNWFILFLAVALALIGALTARAWLGKSTAYHDFEQRVAIGRCVLAVDTCLRQFPTR